MTGQTIKHGDMIKLVAWPIETAKVCTLTGFYNGDAAKVAAWRALRHPCQEEVFCTFAGHCLSANRAFYERDKALNAAAIVVSDGEFVTIDGATYRIKVIPGNTNYPRNSDPIHFVPVLRDAYGEGNSAQKSGLPMSANPYAAGLDRYCARIRERWRSVILEQLGRM